METPVSLQEELRAAVLAEQANSESRLHTEALQEDGLTFILPDTRGTEMLSGDKNPTRNENLSVSSAVNNRTILKEDDMFTVDKETELPSLNDTDSIGKKGFTALNVESSKQPCLETNILNSSQIEKSESPVNLSEAAKDLQEDSTKKENVDLFITVDESTTFENSEDVLTQLNASERSGSFSGRTESSTDSRNSTKGENFGALNAKENNNVFNKHHDDKNTLSTQNILDNSEATTSKIDMNERDYGQSCTGLSIELEDVKEKLKKTTKSRNSLQQKIFELQSEFCSVEIERDLEKETSRYLQEQISSLNSSVALQENELVSLRKRYRLLNEGFLNSETLREGLEKDVDELTQVIRELEKCLEAKEELFKENNEKEEIKAAKLDAESKKEMEKLEREVGKLTETLEKERHSKTNLDELFANVEKERNLLLKEVEELRGERQKQMNEVNMLRELLHDKNKEEQLHQLREQQLQRKMVEDNRQQSEEIAELRENKIHFSNRISLLQEENKKLEDELYQQLGILEKLHVENDSFAKAKEELEGISEKVKVLGFSQVDQLLMDYSTLKKYKIELEAKLSQDDVSKYSQHSEMKCTMSYCVPRSEHIKLKFQLKSATEEINSLKQALEAKSVKEKTSVSRQQRRSRKYDHKIAKKWLKTMKDSMNAFEEDDDSIEGRSTVLLKNQLHEASIRADELQHELEISKRENEMLNCTNRKQQEENDALKRRLVESQDAQNSLLREVKSKLEKAEKNLESEIQRGREKEKRVIHLEEQNQELSVELEKMEEKLRCLREQKSKIENELELMKNDILKYFGSLNIQSVSETFNSEKEKSIEYAKIIERNEKNLLKLSEDLNSLQQVNTVLREELNETRIQLEKKDEEISKKHLSESILEKRESERLQSVIQALESSKQNEAELLSMYTREKQDYEKLHEELVSLTSELQELKMLLSEKENECEVAKHVIQELETTCEVYEVEFEKSKTVQENEKKEDELSSDDSQEDELSESGSDSTAENFREMQEALQQRMAMKVKRLKDRLGEALTALDSCQKLNAKLQQKLHDAEKNISQKEEVDGKTPDKDFLETVLSKLAEKEKEIQEISQKNSRDSRDGGHDISTESNLEERLSTYKQTIKELKVDNAKYEVRLLEANEKVAKLEEKVAMHDNFQKRNSSDVGNDADLSEEANRPNGLLAKKTSVTVVTKEQLSKTDTILDSSDGHVKKELNDMTAKYVNLKAAFEGCLRRLKIFEEGSGVEGDTSGTVNILEKYEPSDVTEEVVVPKFISPLQAKKTETTQVYNKLQEATNFESYKEVQACKDSYFSEISCAFIESDSESVASDRMIIELTLTEDDIDLFENQGTCNESLQERLAYENECGGRLRSRIIELENMNSTTNAEIYRIKRCWFKERSDFEINLKSLQKLNDIIKGKLAGIEMERDSLLERMNQSDAKHSQAAQELQLLKISTNTQQEMSEKTIKELKNEKNNLRKKIMKSETEKEELKKKVEEIQGILKHSSQERERVKAEFSSQEENYRNALNELKCMMDVYKKEKEGCDLQISELKKNVCKLEEEIQKSKEENARHEESISKFEGVIVNMKKQTTELECEKENILLINKEVEHKNEMLIKDQELNMASILAEKEHLKSRIVELQTTINTLEERLDTECTTNGKLTEQSKIQNEEIKARLVVERNTFEDAKRKQQETIMILKKEIEEKRNINELTIKEWESKIGLLNDEKDRSIKALLNEKQIADAIKKELEEKLIIANDNISLVKNDNQSLMVENKKIESQISKCVDEIQRIKSLSFYQRQELEIVVEDPQETCEALKNVTEKDKRTIERLRLDKNDVEAKFLYLQNELERVKVCSFEENQLENKIEKLTGALSSVEVKFEQLKKEKDHLVLKERESQGIIRKLQEEVHRIKVCAFEEQQNMATKAENYKVLVEESKTDLEYQILERDEQISSLKLTISELKDSRQSLESDHSLQQKEMTSLQINVKNLQSVIERFEKTGKDYEHQISSLRKEIIDLEKEKESLETTSLQQAEEILSVKKMVDELRNEKRQLQENVMERDEKVSTLELNISRLEEQISSLENDILQNSKENSSVKILIQNLEKQKKLLKDEQANCHSEITLLKRNVSDLKGEKEFLLISMTGKDEELTELGITMEERTKEINDLKESNVKQRNIILSLEEKIGQLQKERDVITKSINMKDGELAEVRITLENLENERNVLKQDNVKRSNEKSLLEKAVAEIKEEKECLADVIGKQNEEISSFRITLQKVEGEKKDLENDIEKSKNEALLLKENVSQLTEEKECFAQNVSKQMEGLSELETKKTELENDYIALEDQIKKRDGEVQSLSERISKLMEEKDSCMKNVVKREEDLSVSETNVTKLQEEKRILEDSIIKRDTEMELSQANVDKLKKEKDAFCNEISVKNEELSSMKECLASVEERNRALQEDLVKRDGDILLQQKSISALEKEKKSLYNDIAEKDEQLSSMKLCVENLENEKKVVEEDIAERDNEISLNQEILAEIQNKNDSLVDDMAKKDEEIRVLQFTLQNLQNEKDAIEEQCINREKEISLIETTLVELKREKQSLENNMVLTNEDLSLTKQTVEQLQKENEFLNDEIVKRDGHISLQEENIRRFEEEKESLDDYIARKDEELSFMKLTVEKIENETKSSEEHILNQTNKISTLEIELAGLEKEKENLENEIAKKEEEFSSLKLIVVKLENEKITSEDHTFNQTNTISTLEIALDGLEKDKENLKNEMAKKDEELSSIRLTVEKLQNEKKTIEEHVSIRDKEASIVETTLVELRRAKESLENDVVLRDEELSLIKLTVEKLQKANEFLDDVLVKRDSHISLQEESIEKFEGEKECLKNEMARKDEGLSAMKLTVEKFENEKIASEEHILNQTNEISTLEIALAGVEKDKKSLQNEIKERAEELSSMKLTVENLQNEKKVTEKHISNGSNKICTLETTLIEQEKENEELTEEICKRDKKIFAHEETIEKIEAQKNVLQNNLMKLNEEILLLKEKYSTLKEEKESFAKDLVDKDNKISELDIALQKLNNEKRVLENVVLERSGEISQVESKLTQVQEEMDHLRSDLQKITMEKESAESKIKEISEKTKCDEEEFDKLVTNYLQEIDSWKKRHSSVDEEMSVLRNELERLLHEKQDLENIVNEMSESERASEEKFQETIKAYHEDIDSWKVKVNELEGNAEILRKAIQEFERKCENRKLEVARVNKEKENILTKFQKERKNSEKQWLTEKEKDLGNLRLELEATIQVMESKLAAKEKELHDENLKMGQLENNLEELNKIISQKDEEILNFKKSVVDLEKNLCEARNKIIRIQEEYDQKGRELKLSVIRVEEQEEKIRKMIETDTKNEKRVLSLENEIKRLSKVLEESELELTVKQEKYENQLQDLREKMKLMESDASRLQNELSAIRHQSSENQDLEKTVKNDLENSREKLRVLLADIDETAKIKQSLEEETQGLESKVEELSGEKTKLELNVFCLKEITEELTKGKLTLLEEIARLSDEKKEKQESLSAEFARLRTSMEELKTRKEEIEKENSELIVQISSLKVTLATIESAYEQTQDEVKDYKTRLEEAIRQEKQSNKEKEVLGGNSKKFEVKIKYLEERNRSITSEKKELYSSFNETRKHLESLEKEFQTIKDENVVLLQRLKQQQNGGEDDESLENGKSSSQASALRKKLKEFRAKLSEEKKQREIHEFDIKNLKEKVERMMAKEKEGEAQLENTRKKFLEVKTERDGLLMDIDSLNKRKKKDTEGYISKIETLENELRISKAKETNISNENQTKATINVLNEERKILELKLASTYERHQKEVSELKTKLESLENRYVTEMKRFETSEAANKEEIIELRKSLSSIERERENQRRELEKIQANFVVVKGEKEKIENVLGEKNIEVNKWKKEALNDKAEIQFLRGSLNILEKEGLASKCSVNQE